MPPDRIRRATAWLARVGSAGPGIGPRTPRPRPVPPPRTPELPEPAEPEVLDVLDSVAADPTERLPDGLAKLMVQRVQDVEGNPAYLLTGASGGADGPPYTGRDPQLPPLRISLGRIRPDGAYPSQFYRAVGEWSRLQRPLVRWLNGLRDRHGDDLHLVVWDDTDYEIPWEMLWLGRGDAGEPSPGLLGALVPVARWTTIRELHRSLLDGPAHCEGRVVGYFDGRMRQDADVFRPFAHEQHTDVDRFLGCLDGADRDLGLVYMGCHGTYGRDIDDLTAGLLTWYELNEPAMGALRGATAGTLVCLNVCHSGRLVDNKDGGEDALRGFSELFLRKGAKACIATRGEVGETEARALLGHLVEHARRSPDRPLAHMLRDFRARAAAELPTPVPRTKGADGVVDRDGQRQVLRVLYQFMYVYYGHPLTTLRLVPSGPDGAR